MGIVELEQQARAWAADGEIKKKVYPHQIAFNLLPHVDAFLDDGFTKEEIKMLNEGRKIMGIDDLRVMHLRPRARLPRTLHFN